LIVEVAMKFRSFAMGLCTVVSFSFCSAQHMNQPGAPCAGTATTIAFVACLDQAGVQSEAEMDALYHRIKSRLDGSELEELTTTQELWVKYRDANCAAERSLYKGGSGGPPAQLACIESMTRARIKELQVTYAVRLKE
jgi:uncharacterized protein YecT (DUF1311 family)